MQTLSEIAKLLGAKGGKARAKNLTKEQQSAIGRKAVEARILKMGQKRKGEVKIKK